MCNALIQSHFDCVCSAWFLSLNKKFKSKLQTIQNKCIRHRLELDNKSHIGMKDFEEINRLSVSERFNQYLCSNSFKFLKKNCPLYFHDIYYRQPGQNQANARSPVLKLKHPWRNTCSGQNSFSILTTLFWNSLPTELKLPNSLNNFKHKLKYHGFQET